MVYGICLPMPGFSALFIVVALSAVLSALVAGAMLHRLQLRENAAVESRKMDERVPPQAASSHCSNANGWLTYGLLRVRCSERPDQRIQKQNNTNSQAAIE